MYSQLIAYTNDFLDTDQTASASGGMLFINGVGAMSGPIVVGYRMTIFGPSAFFGYIGMLLALIGGYGIYRMTQRASTTVDEMAPYLPISNRTLSWLWESPFKQ